jgi:hypothetical protein
VHIYVFLSQDCVVQALTSRFLGSRVACDGGGFIGVSRMAVANHPSR